MEPGWAAGTLLSLDATQGFVLVSYSSGYSGLQLAAPFGAAASVADATALLRQWLS